MKGKSKHSNKCTLLTSIIMDRLEFEKLESQVQQSGLLLSRIEFID